jgi:hypothetical protein
MRVRQSLSACETAAYRNKNFFTRLPDNLIDLRRLLVKSAERMAWHALEDALADTLPPAMNPHRVRAYAVRTPVVHHVPIGHARYPIH